MHLRSGFVRCSSLQCARSTARLDREGAPRKYVIGSRIDFTAGGSNMPSGTGPIRTQEFLPFYGAYPSIEMTSTGEHSVLKSSYAFGYDRIDSNTPWISRSHAASSTLSVRNWSPMEGEFIGILQHDLGPGHL